MIDVLYVFDNNYAPYAGISITSLLKNCSCGKQSIRVFLATMNDISEKNVNKIEKTISEYGQIFIWVDTKKAIDLINSCNTGYWNGSKATWLKVFVIWELPRDVKQILYIDSDTIVEGDISTIASVSLGMHPTAQVLDSLGNTRGKKQWNLDQYYNAGIVLFNADIWRNDDFRGSFLNHFSNNVEKYQDNEQGLLNDFLRNSIMRLPLEYNVQGFLLLFSEDEYLSTYNDFPFYSKHEIEDAKSKPVIYHFFRVFGDYPWECGNMHPLKDEYLKWKNQSEWQDEVKCKSMKNVVFVLEKILYLILPKKWFISLYRKMVE